MAEGLAALLQDEEVVGACYSAEIAADVLDAFDLKMHKLTLLPHIHRPTAAGVKKRAHKLQSEMAEISGTGGTVLGVVCAYFSGREERER
jgi:hypothetical protein